MSRRKARELTMQCLYQQDIQNTLDSEQSPEFWASHRVDSETREFAEALLERYREEQTRVDSLISEHLQNWNFARMAIVDRNILRMAIVELLLRLTPSAVVIDQAVEIARKFGGNESKDFVNGVLDAVRRHLEEEDLEKA